MIIFTDSYDALNHRLIIVFCAACKTYPPNPKTTLPANIIPHIFFKPPNPKITCPKTQKLAVKIRAILGPLLSISIPPSKGTITFGNAYNEYNKLNVA
jgi:hypothetical protein